MRGVGLRVDIRAQTGVWQWLKAQKGAHRSVLSKNPAGYPGDAPDSRCRPQVQRPIEYR
ncbi:hypothetical protein [Paraburkholderia strydomiana]|uniref:hypothetical protein n=1 Tax=Paraburkholderia strydomiana TaxID=1245417 RepID=UPI00333C36E9